VSLEQLEVIADRIERQCMEAFDKEVPSKVIGNLIMQELRQLDQVAYVRSRRLPRVQGRHAVPRRAQAHAREATGGWS
jgi:transcriptional regulator NrdR family protein